jgi:hypothetical protein
VFILGYPDPARGSDGTLCGNFTSILSSDAWSFAENSIIAKLNDLIGHKADYYGWHKIADFNNIPADISTSNSFLTHGYCAASTWFRPFLYDGGNTAGDQQLGTYDVQGDVDGVFHPNNEGHKRMSESIAQSIQQVFF